MNHVKSCIDNTSKTVLVRSFCNLEMLQGQERCSRQIFTSLNGCGFCPNFLGVLQNPPAKVRGGRSKQDLPNGANWDLREDA